MATAIEEDHRMVFQDLVCTHNMLYGPLKRPQMVARDWWFQRDDAPVHITTLPRNCWPPEVAMCLKISFFQTISCQLTSSCPLKPRRSWMASPVSRDFQEGLGGGQQVFHGRHHCLCLPEVVRAPQNFI